MFLSSFKRLFLYFTEFGGHLLCSNLAKIPDTVPLTLFSTSEVGCFRVILEEGSKRGVVIRFHA